MPYKDPVKRREYMREYRRIWDERNPERRQEINRVSCRKRYRKKRQEYIKRAALRAAEEKARNPEKYRKDAVKRVRKYATANRGKINAIAAKYRASRQNPKWADKVEISRIYRECPAGWHVDHIVPLRGRNVSGLHVPWNLQYLPAAENCRKNNRLISESGAAAARGHGS